MPIFFLEYELEDFIILFGDLEKISNTFKTLKIKPKINLAGKFLFLIIINATATAFCFMKIQAVWFNLVDSKPIKITKILTLNLPL